MRCITYIMHVRSLVQSCTAHVLGCTQSTCILIWSCQASIRIKPLWAAFEIKRQTLVSKFKKSPSLLQFVVPTFSMPAAEREPVNLKQLQAAADSAIRLDKDNFVKLVRSGQFQIFDSER